MPRMVVIIRGPDPIPPAMYLAINVALSRLGVDDGDGAGFRRRCLAHISNPGMSITPKINPGSGVSHTAAIDEGSASTEKPHDTASSPCRKARLVDFNMSVRRDVCSGSVPRSLLTLCQTLPLSRSAGPAKLHRQGEPWNPRHRITRHHEAQPRHLQGLVAQRPYELPGGNNIVVGADNHPR